MTREERAVSEQMWLVLTRRTKDHEFYCSCGDCLNRTALSAQLITEYEIEFQERKARIEKARV